MEGMTIKQMAKKRFFDLCESKKNLDLNTEDGKRAFVVLSVWIHAAKGNVPKRLWKYAR